MSSIVKNLRCTCCAGSTTGFQFWNLDNGFGLCNFCIPFVARGSSDISDTYGTFGLHYARPVKLPLHQVVKYWIQVQLVGFKEGKLRSTTSDLFPIGVWYADVENWLKWSNPKFVIDEKQLKEAPNSLPMTTLLDLWRELGDIPTFPEGDDVDCIEEPFAHFPIGTHREDIWHWFETKNTLFLVGEVMNNKRKFGLL